MKIRETFWDYFIITVGTVIVAISVYFFLMPSNVVMGSISGLAIVISKLLPLPVSVLTMIMNVVLLVFGFFTIGKDFGIKTVYTSLLMPVVMWIFEQMFPNFQSLTGDQTLDVICTCMVLNIGLSILFLRNASSGGVDIIAKFLNKYFRVDLGKAMSVSGMVIVCSSIVVYDVKAVILGLLGTYFSGIVLDYMLFGSTIKKRVCIISEKREEIIDFILYDLHSGATLYDSYGAFTGDKHTEINTLVDKNEYIQLINYITKIDPDAFVTVYAVNEMMYRPKPIVKRPQ